MNDTATTAMNHRHKLRLRRFYFYAVLGAAIIVFVGFAQSYFLKGFFGTPPLYPLLHIRRFHHDIVVRTLCHADLAD